MKHFRALTSALLIAMTLTYPTSALTYPGLGKVTSQKNDIIADGVEFTRLSSRTEAGKSQNAYILEYRPDGAAVPTIGWGDTVWGMDPLSEIVNDSHSDSENSEAKPVFGAVNGDFYSMQTGVPLGVVISDGKLISGDDDPENPHYAIGFYEDGTAIIGRPLVKMSLTNLSANTKPITIDYYNKYPTIWGAYLVDESFKSSTMSKESSLEIILELDGKPTAKGSVNAKVREVIKGSKNLKIPEGCAVLTIADSCAKRQQFNTIKKGDRLVITTECAKGWENVQNAIGGGDVILSKGVMPEGIIDEEHEKYTNPRTAVGIREDGSVVFFAVDGRTSASRGLTIKELSQLLAELGCVEAINLDGGGSTTVMVKYPNTERSVYVNTQPGGYRAISNGILLVSKYESDGIPAVIMSEVGSNLVLTGSTIEPEVILLDRTYTPLRIVTDEAESSQKADNTAKSEQKSEAAAVIKENSNENTAVSEKPAEDKRPSFTEMPKPDKLELEFADVHPQKVGTIDGGRFTAGQLPGRYNFNATGEYGENKLSGKIDITVTSKLDSLSVTPKLRRIVSGDTVKLEVTALLGGKRVATSPESFWYTLNGKGLPADPVKYPDAITVCELGYINKNGDFVAFDGVHGRVEIGIWYNEFVEYVTVSVENGEKLIADFTKSDQIGQYLVSSTDSIKKIKLGYSRTGFISDGAFELEYSYKSTGGRLLEIKSGERTQISAEAKSLKLWVGGDISGKMSAIFIDADGRKLEVDYRITMDYSKQYGWCELTAALPEGHGELTLDSLLVITNLGEGTKTLLIDDAVIDYVNDSDVLTGVDIQQNKITY